MRTSGGDPERAALDAALLDWMQEAARDFEASFDDARFERLALELFAFQYERCAPFARLCRRRGRTPREVGSWRDIPAVPTGAFKEMALRSFPEQRGRHVFRTSGTATQRRGELHLDTLALYEASLTASFAAHLLPEHARTAHRARLRVLAPAPDEVPDSSLSHMFGTLLHVLGDAGSGFDVDGGVLQIEHLLRALAAAQGDRIPVVLCGTAFSFVHLLDGMRERGVRLCLPAGSRGMETGGFKGRSREVTRDALYGMVEERLGIPPQRMVNQYGMTELGSQFYDSVLRRPEEPRRKLGPPWARVRIVEAESGAQVAPGGVGAIQVVDLANTGSVLAVETADLGRKLGDGFEVLGRAGGAEARGCSIAADAMLAGST